MLAQDRSYNEVEIDLALQLAQADGQSWERGNVHMPTLLTMYGEMATAGIAWFKIHKADVQ